jgi:hypothetical protein
VTPDLRKPLLCAVALLVGLSNCNPPKQSTSGCPSSKQEVFLYIQNRSFRDTLARAHLAIDDSVYLDSLMLRSRDSGGAFYKAVRLCPGAHQLAIRFGRFQRDTTLVIGPKISLFITMYYLGGNQPLVLTPDGINISSIIRDGSAAID